MTFEGIHLKNIFLLGKIKEYLKLLFFRTKNQVDEPNMQWKLRQEYFDENWQYFLEK